MIEARSLVKHFEAVEALRGVSFSCREGEVFGLLGPNGAGKTTCLRVLSTVLSPTRGTASLAGLDLVRDAERVRRIIGVLPANAGLYGRLTARENLRYFGRLHDMEAKRLEARIDELLHRLELGEAIDRRTDSFSSGMRQKVALARAILHDPPMIFLDEPTEGLDVPTARTVYEMVEELRAAGKCLIFSTHRMEEAERLCTRIGIIARGEMRAMGTLAELRREAGTDDLEEAFLRLVGDKR
ncbi:MAG: ABC transporter ATP-binding protein [Patescibacteria group bacterium]